MAGSLVLPAYSCRKPLYPAADSQSIMNHIESCNSKSYTMLKLLSEIKIAPAIRMHNLTRSLCADAGAFTRIKCARA